MLISLRREIDEEQVCFTISMVFDAKRVNFTIVTPFGVNPTKKFVSIQKLSYPIHFKNIYKKVIAKRSPPSQSLLFLKIVDLAWGRR